MKYIVQYKNQTVILIAFLFSFIVYFPARHAMLIDDGISGIWEVLKNQNGGFINAYGFDSFYYVLYGFIRVVYYLFGLQSVAWYVLFVMMHAINTELLFVFCTHLKNKFNLSWFFPITSAMLFMSSAYQSENVIWGATQHYAIGLMLLLISLNIILSSRELTKFKIIQLALLFLLSLVTIEMAFMFPAIYIATIVLLNFTHKTHIRIKPFVLKVIMPQLLLCVIYVYCLQKFHHTVVPHAGSLERFNLFTIEALHNYAKIYLKIFAFTPYWTDKIKSLLLQLPENNSIAIIIICLPLIVTYILYRTKQNVQVYIYFIATAFICLIPFLNSYLVTVFRYENDRHQYFASAFLYLSLAYALSVLTRRVKIIVIVVLISMHVIFTYNNANVRKQSGILHESFITQYPYNNKKKTYIINTPCNLKGAYVFRADYRFPIEYEVKKGKDIFNTQQQIIGYIAQTPYDSFVVKKINDSCFDIHSTTDGVWYIHNGVGASDYETKDYIYKSQEWGFIIQFKHKLNANERLLLYNRGKFEQVQ